MRWKVKKKTYFSKMVKLRSKIYKVNRNWTLILPTDRLLYSLKRKAHNLGGLMLKESHKAMHLSNHFKWPKKLSHETCPNQKLDKHLKLKRKWLTQKRSRRLIHHLHVIKFWGGLWSILLLKWKKLKVLAAKLIHLQK